MTIKKAKTLTTTIKKLKGKATYYVRIRTYTTVKKKNYYSTWSKAKTVKVKAGSAKNEFNEDVDVDIYAPFEKKLDKENFEIKVKDYSYVVNNFYKIRTISFHI